MIFLHEAVLDLIEKADACRTFLNGDDRCPSNSSYAPVIEYLKAVDDLRRVSGWPHNLATSIAVGAAACLSFGAGVLAPGYWYPGCGRPLPTWGTP